MHFENLNKIKERRQAVSKLSISSNVRDKIKTKIDLNNIGRIVGKQTKLNKRNTMCKNSMVED